MTKKLFIGALVFFIIAAGIAGYVLFLKPSSSGSTGNQNQGTNTSSTNYQPFPIGQNQSQTNVSNGNATTARAPNGTTTPATVAIQTLTQLYTQPIAGAAIEGGGKVPEFIRLTDRATGHMFDITLSSSTSVETELSDQTIPKMDESLWLNNGSTTILRYLDSTETTIKTYSATLVTVKKSVADATTTPTNPLTISGIFLPDNIESIATNPSGKQIFYLTESASGVTGSIVNANSSKASAIFSSPIIDWNSQWPSANTIALSTKASSVANGYLYFLSTKGTVTRILGNIPGLVTVVDPSASSVAYSDSGPTLSIYTISTGTTVNTGISTIAQKCAWSPDKKGILYCAVPNTLPTGHFPDSWYQGVVSFSDSIYRIDTNDNQATLVNSISQTAKQNIDAINLEVSPQDDYLTFTNKNDLSLWALRLSAPM
jgi:hypothetical protein